MTEMDLAFIAIVSIAVIFSLFILYCYHIKKKEWEKIESRIRDIKVGDIFCYCESVEDPFKNSICFFLRWKRLE